jgi:hypothetical protein
VELLRDEDRYARASAAAALGWITAGDLRVFAVPFSKRFFAGTRVVRRIEELDPEQPATS